MGDRTDGGTDWMDGRRDGRRRGAGATGCGDCVLLMRGRLD